MKVPICYVWQSLCVLLVIVAMGLLTACGGASQKNNTPYSPSIPKAPPADQSSVKIPEAAVATEQAPVCGDLSLAFRQGVMSMLESSHASSVLRDVMHNVSAMRWVARSDLSQDGKMLLRAFDEADAHGLSEEALRLDDMRSLMDAYVSDKEPAEGIRCEWEIAHLKKAIALELAMMESLVRYSLALKYNHPGEALTRWREQARRDEEAKQKERGVDVAVSEMQEAEEPLSFEERIKAWVDAWKHTSSQTMVRQLRSIHLGDESLQKYLNQLVPSHPHYQRLFEQSRRYRSMHWEPLRPFRGVRSDKGHVASHPNITKLGARLAAEGYMPESSSLVEEGVQLYARANGVAPWSANFWRALNVPAEDRYQTIRLNLRRIAASAMRDANNMVFVNIPDYSLELWKDGKRIQRKRVVVGRARQTKCDEETKKTVYAFATPTFSAEIEKVIFAPYWNVPKDIKETELDVKAASSENYLRANGYEVVHENNYEYVRQLPSPANALGFVKLIFPNRYGVYLHDTPEQKFFEANQRAFSHGCIRLQEPLELARAVLEEDGQWDGAQVQSLYAAWLRKEGLDPDQPLETVVTLKNPQLIVVDYLTAWADENHHVHFVNDVYNMDNPNPRLGRACTPPSKAAMASFNDVSLRVQSLVTRAEALAACFSSAQQWSAYATQSGLSPDPRVRPARAIMQFADQYRTLAASIQNRYDALSSQVFTPDRRQRWSKRRIDEALMISRLVDGFQSEVTRTENLCRTLKM